MTISVTGVRSVGAFADTLRTAVNTRFASRLFAKDATLWGEAAEAEAAERLGWTDFGEEAQRLLAEAGALADDFAARGITRIVLCGMGGSSLAPGVIAPTLSVLDSTNPDTVRAAIDCDLSATAVVVSSKSGGTVETLSHMRTFEAAFAAAGIDPAERIIVITDPGSSLEQFARATGKRVFLADPTVGGRFSALAAFGIVPSVLAGADMATIVSEAQAIRDSLSSDSEDNPALVLAAALAAELPARYAVELQSDGTLPDALGLWIEQLVAESTGKDGKGLLPVAVPADSQSSHSDTSTIVRLTANEVPDSICPSALHLTGTLGEQLFLWQVATAALGFMIGVDPFNQPDVEAAKIATRESLGAPAVTSLRSPTPTEVRNALRAAVSESSYVAVQAYVDTTDAELGELLAAGRKVLVTGLGVPVSFGYGPRYLHSTGQFHKGGPAHGVFLQLVDTGAEDLPIPGEDASFGTLMLAQARGDASVLRSRGRTVITIEAPDVASYLRTLLEHTAVV